MERIIGVPLSKFCVAEAQSGDVGLQQVLIRALSVAALSVIDNDAVFHGDLHSGNMLVVQNASGGHDHIAFIDFGFCGCLPPLLRGALLMQASAFAGGEPDVRQFARGFAHALQRMQGLDPKSFDTDALALAITPLLAELKRSELAHSGVDPMDPRLRRLLVRLRLLLYRHGVQIPREFTRLAKMGCFTALYFSLFDDDHRQLLMSQLAKAGAAYCASNPIESRQLLSLASFGTLFQMLRESDRCAYVCVAKPYLKGAAALVATGLPLYWVGVNYIH